MADTVTTAAQLADQATRPEAPVQTKELREARPKIVGPDLPESPFPVFLEGPVQTGFGRGGKELGCPTANLPDECIEPISSVAKPGVYYGYAQISPPADSSTTLGAEEFKVLPMVMSLGWNPYYKNERLTAEIHILHTFASDFYGYPLKAIVLGYIRPELDFTSVEALIEDIEIDKQVAKRSLDRPEYTRFENDAYFKH